MKINNDNYNPNINYDLLRKKGLCDEVPNEEYFKLLNKYKNMFENYLMNKLPLQLLDDSISDSPFKFEPLKDDKKDFYQGTSSMGLKYIYLRNNLYIENLSNEELEQLKNTSNEEEFIENTYKKVIDQYSKEDNVKHIEYYGPNTDDYITTSDSLVFGIRYDEFYQNGMTEEEWSKNFYDQNKFIAKIIGEIEFLLPAVIDCNVTGIKYNDISIGKEFTQIK